MGPTRKRVKLTQENDDSAPAASTIREQRMKFLSSLSRQVSPPRERSRAIFGDSHIEDDEVVVTHAQTTSKGKTCDKDVAAIDLTTPEPEVAYPTSDHTVIPSPVQLTRIRDLPESENVDTVSLHDILGDPLIKEAWIFNFCFDVDWTMRYFNRDVRDLVKVKIVHGSWRREDTNKILIDEACARWANVDGITAYLPDPFGTHHSKMFVLFRHDDQAQVIIHTANMLEKDWTNMTQAVWRSPLLPQRSGEQNGIGTQSIGERFKHDLLRYLKAYGNKLKPLTQQLQTHDFGAVKAALVASVPSEFSINAPENDVWGYESLRRTLKNVRTSSDQHLVFQVSSIASLPATWLAETLFRATGASSKNVSVIFPTAEDVRMSLDGYSSGGSIHTKAQRDVHLRQIAALRGLLCRWTRNTETKTDQTHAGRNVAAPHIKTYIAFSTRPSLENPAPDIDWALVTSANLSTQAWGSAAKLPKGKRDPGDEVIKIQSFEMGVLIWPDVFKQDTMTNTRLLPTFRNDLMSRAQGDSRQVCVGFRMPYDLPLVPYLPTELPWSPQSSYGAPDRHGNVW